MAVKTENDMFCTYLKMIVIGVCYRQCCIWALFETQCTVCEGFAAVVFV